MSNKSSKREAFEGHKRGRGHGRGGGRSGGMLAAIVVAILVVAGAGLILRAGGFGGKQAGAGTGTVKMTDIELASAGGELSIPMATVREKGLVRFVYKGEKEELPLLAYVAPSGKVVAAVSMCEPCASTRFTIQGNRIVCNACGSQWDLETLRGVSGGCLKYPPDRLESTEKDGKLIIDETIVAAWRPRV